MTRAEDDIMWLVAHGPSDEACDRGRNVLSELGRLRDACPRDEVEQDILESARQLPLKQVWEVLTILRKAESPEGLETLVALLECYREGEFEVWKDEDVHPDGTLTTVQWVARCKSTDEEYGITSSDAAILVLRDAVKAGGSADATEAP